MRYKVIVLGTLLAGAVLGSTAMTLGRARGAAWIGQPLSLTVPVQLDAGQTAAMLCPEADVFHAENKVESGRVSVAIEPTAQPESVNLRITSSATIDEPVVTIYLRAGCSQKTTRKFVLLADYPTEILAPVAATPPEPAPVRPAQVSPESPSPAKASPPEGSPTEARTAPAKAKVDRPRKTHVAPSAKPTPMRAPAPATTASVAPEPAANRPAKSAPTVAAKPADGARSRLKLDPLENLAERIKTLEATTSTVPLEEMVRDSQRIQQLQTDVKALLEQAAKNEASLLAMRQRMEIAESERVSMGIVWALGALVLVCLAAVAALWSRNRKTELSAWQQSVQEAAPPSVPPAPAPVVAEPVHHTPPAPKPAAKDVRSSFNSTIQMEIDQSPMDVDVNLMDMDSDFSRLIAPAPAAAHPATVVGGIHESRLAEARLPHPDFYADSIIDVRQQAEFFEKLGKIDQAIDVLEKRIRLGSKDAPLLYLDLLHIAHEHNLKTDFRQFRDEFEGLFNVNVPEFVLFADSGRSLESYPSLTHHICQNWPSHAALDMIEACLVRDPWEKNADPFDMGAFSELLMLHGLVTRLIKTANKRRDGDDDSADSQHIDIAM